MATRRKVGAFSIPEDRLPAHMLARETVERAIGPKRRERGLALPRNLNQKTTPMTTTLRDALRAMLDAHALPDDLRQVPDAICAAHDQAEQALLDAGDED